MKKIILAFLLVFSFTFSQAQIIFNEIEADAGNNENAGGEWIELKNIGSATVNLSCWKITNGGSYILNIPNNLQLAAGQYLLIGSASKMMCATCDYPTLNSQFTLNSNGFGGGSGNYANTILLNTDLSGVGGCNCQNGTGALANGNGVGERIVLYNASGVIQDAFQYAGGDNYGTGALTVNFPNLGACVPLSNVIIPAANDVIFSGKTICNDLLSCNSSYARLPDGNNVLPIVYSQNGNLFCNDCTEPCGGASNTASEDHPTPGLPNETTPWTVTLDGNPLANTTTNITICGSNTYNFEYKIFNHQNVALAATQSNGNLGSYVKTNTNTPVNFTTSNFNPATGTTTLSTTLNPSVGSTTYELVWANNNTICGTCPGTTNSFVPNNMSEVASECYTYRKITIFRENQLGGTANASCTIPGSVTLNGATGTNLTYRLEKQITIGGAFAAVGNTQTSNLFGNILDDDADPALPNYRVVIKTNNTICANTDSLIVTVPNTCLGNPICPEYVTIGTGAPTFTPATGATTCANSPVQFSVDIKGVCTNGQVDVLYDSNPAFDPYIEGTPIGSFPLTVGATPAAIMATSKVFINEFVFRPAQGTCIGTPDALNPNSGEWVELYNSGTTAVDLSGWILSDGDWTATIPAGNILAGGAYFLIGGGGTFCSSGVLPDLNIETCNCATVFPSTADIMNLTNTGEQLALYDCSGNYVDGVLWGSSGQGLPDVTDNNAPAAGCGDYITAKSVNLPAASSFAASGTQATAHSGRYRSSTNTWVVTMTNNSVPITPKAANPGGNYVGTLVPLATQCPPPSVTANFTFNLPDTCSLTSATAITVKAIYQPAPLSPCTENAVTASASYTIPSCSELLLSGNGEYCEPNLAPINIASSEPLIGNYNIELGNGTTTQNITNATGVGPFTTGISNTGLWTITNVTPPSGTCPPKKSGLADISIHPIPSITTSPTAVNACYLYGFDLNTINTQIVSTPYANNYRWYNLPSGGSPLNPALINPSATMDYYVSPVNGTSIACEGTRIPVTLNVASIPNDPSILSCDPNGILLLPQSPNCVPVACGNIEFSANGTDWSNSLTYTAADAGWNNWGSPANSGIFIRNLSFPTCLSYFYYVNPCNGPLPVQLISFKASPNEKQAVNLVWEVAEEKNFSHYEIERGLDINHFSKIGEMNTNPQAIFPIRYQTIDSKPFVEESFYRLKMIDQDGKFSYSNIEKVFIKTLSNTVRNIYPNPANNQITIALDAIKIEKIQIQLFDILGKNVMNQTAQLQKGFNQVMLNLDGLASGTYHVKIPFSNGVVVKQFVKE